MARCIELARRGIPHVRTNPAVGCCIVHTNRILSEGFHVKLGGPHAEIMALNNIKEEDRSLLPESTLYVNLEPCNHQGRTGPCSPAIVASGIKNVVIGQIEINDTAQGGGKYLEAHGVNVQWTKLNNEIKESLRPFVVGIQQKRPFITLKWAQSADGFIGNEEEQVHISNRLSQVRSHSLRANNNAILVGSQTAVIDNPRLDTRVIPGSSPIRVILVGTNPLNPSLTLLNDGLPTLLFIPANSTSRVQYNEHIQVETYDTNTMPLLELLQILYHKYDIGYLLVEGGRHTLSSFLEAGLWDVCYRITSSLLMKQGKSAPVLNPEFTNSLTLGEDLWEESRNYHQR